MQPAFPSRVRHRRRFPWLLAIVTLAVPGCTTAPPPAAAVPPPPGVAWSALPRVVPDLAASLAALAPRADPAVLRLAVQAQRCAVASGAAAAPQRLAVIDYSRSSSLPRLWVFDLLTPRLLYVEHVAHGRHSGADLATAFSNREGSLQSSLGLFSAAETYTGENGYSLRLDGLEPGVNDRARERLLVMHGADYVDPAQARRQGRLGRSLGCPALRRAVAPGVIDSLKLGQLLFAYFPDPQWLGSSRFLHCGSASAASKPGAASSRTSATR